MAFQDVFVPCYEGHQWCLFNMSSKSLTGHLTCSWCNHVPSSAAEISYCAKRKIPFDAAENVPLCYPCITGFLAQNSCDGIPQALRYDEPCCGTPCVQAVLAVTQARSGAGTLEPWTRVEFLRDIKVRYGVPGMDSPAVPSRVASPSPLPLMLLPPPPVTTEDLKREVTESEIAILHRVEETELKICKMIAGIHQRLEKLERSVSSASASGKYSWGSGKWG